MGLVDTFDISDKEAENMPEIYRQLRSGYLEWKRSGRLPNGEEWKLAKVIPND